MISERWQELLRRPGALPSLPEVLVRLRAGLYEMDVDIDRLCRELQHDPVLVSEIIRMINSPLFGMRRRIESLKQSVVLLGLRRVRAVILSQSLRQALATYQSPGFALFGWWDRSILNAVVAASLCQRTAPDLIEEAYLAGLVADLGILVMARFEPRYERLLGGFAEKGSEDLRLAERDRLDTDHAALTAAIFEFWKFPPTVVHAIGHHHDPAVFKPDQTFFLPRAVCFAVLTTDCVVARSEPGCQRLAELAAAHMFLSRDELTEFVNGCLDRYRSMATSLGHGALAERGIPPGLARPA